MREFATAAQRVVDENSDERDTMIEFKVGDRICYADKTPGDGQLAVLMATTTKHSGIEEQVAGTINFLFSVLDEESHTYLVSRLLDRKDPFGMENVTEILGYLMEEWSGRPTVSSPGSTASPRSDGPRSTPATPELTSSGSHRMDS